MGEYLINALQNNRFVGYSAGADPKGLIHPMTLRVLKEFFNIDASHGRSKSWEEFKNNEFDFVVTVCDNARESCPRWPGKPIIAHWSSPDPAAFQGTDEETFRFFKSVGLQIQRRIQLLESLPVEKLDRIKLLEATREIGDQAKLEETSQT